MNKFMWIILAALCFGAVFDGLGAVKAIESFFIDRIGLGPWKILFLLVLERISRFSEHFPSKAHRSSFSISPAMP